MTLALSLARATLNPPDGAVPVRVTVQMAAPGPVRLAGEQLNALSCVEVVKLMVVVRTRVFTLPVMVTV